MSLETDFYVLFVIRWVIELILICTKTFVYVKEIYMNFWQTINKLNIEIKRLIKIQVDNNSHKLFQFTSLLLSFQDFIYISLPVIVLIAF